MGGKQFGKQTEKSLNTLDVGFCCEKCSLSLPSFEKWQRHRAECNVKVVVPPAPVLRSRMVQRANLAKPQSIVPIVVPVPVVPVEHYQNHGEMKEDNIFAEMEEF